MIKYLLFSALGLLALSAALVQNQQPAFAAFHCMRIHAVMGGFSGNDLIQYVELRMNASGQGKVGTHQVKFYDSTGTLKATFTFPNLNLDAFGKDVENEATGDSILIATAEYDANNTGPGAGGSGGEADFVFSTANTVGANGGDPDHPIQFPDGKITFAEGAENCTAPLDSVVDSVAYGAFSGSVDFGSAAAALPSPSDTRALRLNNLSLQPSNNSTEYALEATSSTAKTVAQANLGSDPDTPRNNAREVATLQADADGDGVGDGSDLCASTATGAAVDANGCSQPQVDQDLDGACDPAQSSPLWCTGTDICPAAANAFQADLDGDTQGDACDSDIDGDADPNTTDPDDDNDGVHDTSEGQCRDDHDNDGNGTANDGCPPVGTAESGPQCNNNTDDDADGYVNDGCSGASETNACGSDPFDPGSRPERLDAAFAGTDDDGDTTVDEALPPISGGLDCDGDGWTGAQEQLIFSAAGTANDQDPCGNNGWAADVDPSNFLNIGDINSFTSPARPGDDGHGLFNKFGHPLDDDGDTVIDPGMARWNLDTSSGHTAATAINIGDINALTAPLASTAAPPMYGGAVALLNDPDGPGPLLQGECPWSP